MNKQAPEQINPRVVSVTVSVAEIKDNKVSMKSKVV